MKYVIPVSFKPQNNDHIVREINININSRNEKAHRPKPLKKLNQSKMFAQRKVKAQVSSSESSIKYL